MSHYRKFILKGKVGVTLQLILYRNKQTSKTQGSKEIKAILRDIYANREKYGITHFTTISANTKSDDNWLSLSSNEYNNDDTVYIPTQDKISFMFNLESMEKPI